MRTPGAAARHILHDIHPLPLECIPLPDALDRVLGQDTKSPIDLPPWDNSAMDGYAVRGDDFPPGTRESGGTTPPVELRVVETIPAGGFPTRSLEAGECARIFTGAPLPPGADGVVRQEDTTPLGGDRVRIDRARDVGGNLRRRGEDIERDAVVLQAEVYVHRKPTVAILGSGDEIADLDEAEAIRSGRKIASSNTYTLLALVHRAGGAPLNLGIAHDDPASLRQKLQAALSADLLVTSGGISVGEHDHLRHVIEDMGGTIGFWRIAMRPGAPVGFGALRGTPWIGLPGNPVSTMVTFELFVRPAIRKMLGHATFFRRAVPVRVAEPLHYPPPLTHFLRATVRPEGGALTARLTGPQGSGILTSMVNADALLVLPAARDDVAPGETLDAILLDEPVHMAEPPFE
jgi:molybdopterin molybdotransferase